MVGGCMSGTLPCQQPTPGELADLAVQALQDGKDRPSCAGCDQPFSPRRTTQRHCRSGCRVTALRKRHVPGHAGVENEVRKNEAADPRKGPTAEIAIEATLDRVNEPNVVILHDVVSVEGVARERDGARRDSAEDAGKSQPAKAVGPQRPYSVMRSGAATEPASHG